MRNLYPATQADVAPAWKAAPVYLCLFLLVVLQFIPTASAQTADRLANAKAIKILEYLRQLPTHPIHRVVSGQYIGSAACCSPSENPEFGAMKYVEDLYKSTGKMIGMVGADYNDFNNAYGDKLAPLYGKPVNYTTLNTLLKKYSRGGSLITIGWHARNPWTGRAWSDLSRLGRLRDLIDPNQRVHAAWIEELDAVAEGLKDLQSADVVVLWRPFLEMNGRWFWWGATEPSQAEFRDVWTHMFQYFTQSKGLHNLLWVFSPNNSFPSNADQKAPIFYYPGSDFVDIAAVDDYHDTTTISQYDELSKLGKPLALGEKGPSMRTAGKGSMTYATLNTTLTRKYPLVSYFQAWAGPHAIINNIGAYQLMNDPMTANQPNVAQSLGLLLQP